MRLKVPKTRGMLRREAATWLARLKSGRDPDVERKFLRWRDRDPSHAEAFERVSKSYEQAGLLRYSKFAQASAGAARRPERSRAPRLRWAAAAALILLSTAGLYLLLRNLSAQGTEAVMLSTKIGEIRRVSLADGSKVTLDTGTRIEIEIGRTSRRALVTVGRARFEVSPGEEPFVIQAGNAMATAAGAILDVEQLGNESQIDVLAGSAKVRGSGLAGGGEQRVAAGEMITAVPGSNAAKHPFATNSDWTRGMLEFEGTPLGSAVALANRYSEQKIVLAAGLERLRISGAFRAGDIRGFASALAEAFHLSVKRTVEGNLVLSPKTAGGNETDGG